MKANIGPKLSNRGQEDPEKLKNSSSLVPELTVLMNLLNYFFSWQFLYPALPLEHHLDHYLLHGYKTYVIF